MANTKRITLAEVKEGMRLPDGKKSEFGYAINKIIEKVHTTPTGRIRISATSSERVNPDGTVEARKIKEDIGVARDPKHTITILID